MLQRHYYKKLQKMTNRGVIVIDKEAGVTSHDEVDRLRRIFKTRRIGHSGTLDPKVTGVLVCGLGKGTKVLEYILLSQKIYDCEIIFHKVITQEQFREVVTKFTGTITQLPPIKSRVKRVERERDIYSLELLAFGSDGRSAQMRCSVERGTYIRKLCHDMGQHLRNNDGEVVGAHMGDLRRIQAGPCSLDNSQVITANELQSLQKKSRLPLIGWWYTKQILSHIEPIEKITKVFPEVRVDARLAKVIASGADLFAPGVLGADEIAIGDKVQIVDQNGTALAIGEAVLHSKDMIHLQKGVAVEVTKVLCG